MAKHQHNRRQPSRDVAPQLATLHLTDPLPTGPNHTTSVSNSALTHHITRPPFAHLPLLRDTAPFNALLHNHLLAVRPKRLPRSRQILRCLLRPLLSA